MDSTVVLDSQEPQVITTLVDITELERAEAKSICPALALTA